jgi:hypothetical protein
MILQALLMQLTGLVCCTTMALGAADNTPGMAETRFLSLIARLSFDAAIADVRTVVPELAELRDQGWGNTNSSFPVQLFGIAMTASFSFSHGKLVSHGVSQRALQKATALRIYQSVQQYFVSQYGPTSEHRGPLQDAHRTSAWSANWTVHGKLLGVYCERLDDGYQVGWGAQSAR